MPWPIPNSSDAEEYIMISVILSLAAALLLILPAGHYVYLVASGRSVFPDPFMKKAEEKLLRFAGVKNKGMNWKEYSFALIATNAFMMLIAYLALRLQTLPIFHPGDVRAMSPSLSFNTVISFMTNSNLQHYAGESALTNLSQMLIITFLMFVSAGSGYAACIAFLRGLQGKTREDMGNFFEDLLRIILRILLPFSFLGGLLLVALGVPMNFQHSITLKTLEGATQILQTGPVAALESIKHLGTNGGGFFAANSAGPMENPTVWTNLVELLSMMLLPGSMVICFGKMMRDGREERRKGLPSRKEGLTSRLFGEEGRSVFLAMGILFLISLSVCLFAEMQGNPAMKKLGISVSGNMEGKEVRFGVPLSALFSGVTTSFTTGSVNNMHDSLMPLSTLSLLMNMLMNVIFGGKGVGLMNMLLYAILAVFLCGLMVGRTPEYLGKKIEGREMKLTALTIILHPLLVLGFTALAVILAGHKGAAEAGGYHALSRMLYEFASSAANNGSAMEGLKDNTLFWNIGTGVVMFLGRYVPILLQLAIAGSLMKKCFVNESAGSLSTGGVSFAVILVVVVCIFSALTFFPALVLGPVAEALSF